MKYSRLLEILNEYVPQRPDMGGVRSRGLDRPLTNRDDTFPYDKETSYGHPANYDRGSKSGALTKPLTARDAKKTAWDDLEEAMGTPINFTKAYSTGQQGGGTVPGMGGSWAKNPSKPWDEEEEVSEAGPLMINPAPPDTEPNTNTEAPYFRDTTDDEVENKINRIWGLSNNPGVDDDDEPEDFSKLMKPVTVFIVKPAKSFMSGLGSVSTIQNLFPEVSAWEHLTKFLQDS